MLVVASRVTNNGSDSNELALDIEAIPEKLGNVTTVLADTGYASEKPIEQLQSRQISVLIPVAREKAPRRHDFRPQDTASHAPKEKKYRKKWIKDMKEKMADPDARKTYRLRKQSVEPVFGIIKQVLGFRQFLLRGLDKADLEWQLVTCAYNLKRLANLLPRSSPTA